MSDNILNIQNLTKAYTSSEGLNQIVLEDLNLHIEWSETSSSIFSILAPFGSGKSTLLKIIAGLESYSGLCRLNGSAVSKPDGKIIYIPEKYYSYHWLSVKENIELPARYFGKKEVREFSTSDLMDFVGLKGYGDFHVSSHESGFKLRIAIARALSVLPKLILLDDALINLDGETTNEIKELLKNVCSKISVAFLMTTTNITDAILLSKKVFLMSKNPGKIIKEIDLSESNVSADSEIFTKTKHEIETTFKLRGIFQSLLVSV